MVTDWHEMIKYGYEDMERFEPMCLKTINFLGHQHI